LCNIVVRVEVLVIETLKLALSLPYSFSCPMPCVIIYSGAQHLLGSMANRIATSSRTSLATTRGQEGKQAFFLH
jgi:hypothetical protein